MTLIAPQPAPVTGICRDAGHPIHYNPQQRLWFHDSPADAFECQPADDRPESVAVEPLRCSHCNDVTGVHQRRRGPLCDGCAAVAPVIAEYGTGIDASAQADGEHIKLRIDTFNPFGSSAYLTPADTRAVIGLLESQLKILGVLGAEKALRPAGQPDGSDCSRLGLPDCETCRSGNSHV